MKLRLKDISLINEARAAADLRPLSAKPRTCLCCSKTFASAGPQNRICGECKGLKKEETKNDITDLADSGSDPTDDNG